MRSRDPPAAGPGPTIASRVSSSQPPLALAWHSGSAGRGVDLTRFRRHLDASGRKPGKVRVQVPRTRPPYPEEFRREAVRLAKLGDKPQRRLAKDLGISDVSLRRWIREEQDASGERPGGLSSDEREELARLRDENAKLRMEREILRKAAVFFAREDDGR